MATGATEGGAEHNGQSGGSDGRDQAVVICAIACYFCPAANRFIVNRLKSAPLDKIIDRFLMFKPSTFTYYLSKTVLNITLMAKYLATT